MHNWLAQALAQCSEEILYSSRWRWYGCYQCSIQQVDAYFLFYAKFVMVIPPFLPSSLLVPAFRKQCKTALLVTWCCVSGGKMLFVVHTLTPSADKGIMRGAVFWQLLKIFRPFQRLGFAIWEEDVLEPEGFCNCAHDKCNYFSFQNTSKNIKQLHVTEMKHAIT